MDKIFRTVVDHRKTPEVSLAQHVRKTRIQLGKEVISKYRIYLDLRFWIFFRDVELGKNINQELVQLLNRIKRLVDEGLAVCPISETVVVELMKQSDDETRLATAKLIDHLSSGVALIVNPERISQELCNAIYVQAGAKTLLPIDELVWSKLSNIFGEIHPHNALCDFSEELVIQKSFFDHMWNVSITEMLSYIDYHSWPQFDWQKTADHLNLANKEHAYEVRSFKQAYRAEFEGGLSLFKERVIKIFQEVTERGYKKIQANDESLSYQELYTKLSKSIRTLHIKACCHAAVRWDKKRQLTGNDLLDFHHAEAALGYCNLFLTEKPLKTLVSQNHLGLNDDFPCAIESSAAGGLRVINSRYG